VIWQTLGHYQPIEGDTLLFNWSLFCTVNVHHYHRYSRWICMLIKAQFPITPLIVTYCWLSNRFGIPCANCTLNPVVSCLKSQLNKLNAESCRNHSDKTQNCLYVKAALRNSIQSCHFLSRPETIIVTTCICTVVVIIDKLMCCGHRLVLCVTICKFFMFLIRYIGSDGISLISVWLFTAWCWYDIILFLTDKRGMNLVADISFVYKYLYGLAMYIDNGVCCSQ